MKTVTVSTLCATILFMSACSSQHPSPTASSVSTPGAAVTATPVDTTTTPIKPAALVLSVDEINAVIRQADPDGTQFSRADPAETTPRNPAEYPSGADDPCNRVAPIDFAGAAPVPVDFVAVPMFAPRQKSLTQAIAVYDSAASAQKVLVRIGSDISACAGTASTDKTYALIPGTSSAETIRYTRGSLENTEYRLAGAAIVGTSSTAPAAVVTAVVDKLVGKLG